MTAKAAGFQVCRLLAVMVVVMMVMMFVVVVVIMAVVVIVSVMVMRPVGVRVVLGYGFYFTRSVGAECLDGDFFGGVAAAFTHDGSSRIRY